MSEWVTAFAPASIGNMAVGFDMLGLALENRDIGGTPAGERSRPLGAMAVPCVYRDQCHALDRRIHPLCGETVYLRMRFPYPGLL